MMKAILILVVTAYNPSGGLGWATMGVAVTHIHMTDMETCDQQKSKVIDDLASTLEHGGHTEIRASCIEN